MGNRDFAASVMASLARVPEAGRFGRKVFVRALYHAFSLGDDAGAWSLDSFKRALVEANRRGDLELARADLVGAMDPALVAASEVRDALGWGLESTWHFVIDPARAW